MSYPATWPHLIEDYPKALVRISTLRADAKHYLLFGWVELFPFDTKVPARWTAGEKPWRVPGARNWTCSFSATPTNTKEALDWYASACSGEVSLDVHSGAVGKARVLNVGPEPAFGGFCTNVEAPFAYPWHGAPRIHRLVPLSPPSEPVRHLGKRPEARAWLKENLGFDPFDYEQWICGLALVAPNPLCSAINLSLGAIGDGGSETVTLCIVPRRSSARGIADLASLSFHIAEKRLDGWASVKTLTVNQDGYATLSYPQMTGSVAYALVCSKRGLLHFVEPTHWIQQVRLGMMAVPGTLQVQVPAGGRRKPGKAYNTPLKAHSTDIQVGQLIDEEVRTRLIRLKYRRQERVEREQASQRVFGLIDKAFATEAEINAKRAEAEDFVNNLIDQARKRIIFVDSFFGLREFALFALRNQQTTLVPRVLTGVPALKIDVGPSVGFQIQQGGSFAAGLLRLESTPNLRTPQVRVMPGQESPIIHDRYIVIDDSVWHFGPSFNEIGKRIGVAVKLQNPIPVRRFISRIWCRSIPLLELWREAQSASEGGK
jgi:hypothetical protein